MPDTIDILVTRQKPHGIPMGELVEILRSRLQEATVTAARTRDEERTCIESAEVVVGNYIDTELLDAAANLSLFACSYAGYEHLPLDELKKHGVTVTNAGGVHAPNVAEHAVGGLLASQRGLLESRRRQLNHEWRSHQVGELAGGTVTVVGLGAIGTAICERLAGFGVERVGVRHSPEKGGPVDRVFGYDRFETAVCDADAVIFACPLTETTRHLLDANAIKTLPPEAIVVNVARGPVVDTDALVSALRRNRIGGAALDVTDPEPLPPDHPLWDFENVLITPHNAGHTPAYFERLADIIEENVERFREHGEWTGLRNQVSP